MNTELMEALTILEKEKNISRDVMMDAIENSLLSACKNHFGTAENIKVMRYPRHLPPGGRALHPRAEY